MNPTLPQSDAQPSMLLNPPRRMTLIIGLKCKDSVVLASDGQITTDTHKRLGETKVEAIQFANFPALVAQCGGLVLSNRYVNVLANMAKSESPQTPDDVGRIIQRAMYSWRNEVESAHGWKHEDMQVKLLEEGYNLGVIVGFLIGNKPHLITITMNHPLYHISKQDYEAQGVGGLLGKYLLAEHALPKMELAVASVVSAYVVETVTQHDNSCGIPIKIMAIKPGYRLRRRKWNPIPKVVNFSHARIKRFSEIGQDAAQATRKDRVKLIHDYFAEEQAQTFLGLDKMLAALPALTAKDIENMAEHPDTPDITEIDD